VRSIRENLENLEKSGNFVGLEKSGKSQGILFLNQENQGILVS
jgi:hypothetical protein